MKKPTVLKLEYQADSSHYFEHFINLPYASFLDSCATSYEGENGRFDIITAAPAFMVVVDPQGQLSLQDHQNETLPLPEGATPFTLLSHFLNEMSTVHADDMPFTGGALGYWGYELGELIEPEKMLHRQTSTPMMSVGLYYWALINDHQKQETSLVFHPDMTVNKKQDILDCLDRRYFSEADFTLHGTFEPTQSREEYNQAFGAIQNYINAGDCYEVNLTQEFTAAYTGNSWEAYKALREISPAPYSAYLNHPDLKILSHSPERFIKVENRQVETNPIKGTRPRGLTPEEDQRYAHELQESSKDRAENLMIVDLLRNDLGKVCETGSIKVPRLFALESYANVHHLVSAVTGTLPEETDVFSLLSSAFPGGSITGAPKIRSMEIIRELEPAARTIYCGAIGYASCHGNMDTSITIRTILAQNNRMHCWGGGAIVADSVCEEEYQESITKVHNLMSALEMFA